MYVGSPEFREPEIQFSRTLIVYYTVTYLRSGLP
jgi:hypothetical protein